MLSLKALRFSLLFWDLLRCYKLLLLVLSDSEVFSEILNCFITCWDVLRHSEAFLWVLYDSEWFLKNLRQF